MLGPVRRDLSLKVIENHDEGLKIIYTTELN